MRRKLHISFFLTLLGLIFSSSLLSQCPNDNSLWIDLTPTGAGNTQTSNFTWAGDYNTFTVCNGAQYTVTTCGSPFDTELTLYNQGTGTLIGSADLDVCSGFDESITFTATFSGVVRALLDRSGCGTGSTDAIMNVTQNTACPPSGGAGDNCANADRIACGDPILAGETTIGNTNTATNWSCYTPITTPGEDHYYVVQWPDAAAGGVIRLNFTNVVDANDPYLEVLALGSSCAANTCVDGDQLTIATGLFASAVNFYEYTVPAGITDYYFVVDAQVDGITSYDLQVTCFLTGLVVDTITGCTPVPVTAPANQGYYQTWNGAAPPATQDPSLLTGTYTICENIYIRNAGWEWLKYFNVTLGACWINTSNYTPNGTNNGQHSYACGGSIGDWTATLAAGVISWSYVHAQTGGSCGNTAWGDGSLLNNNYTCALYIFCYDAQVDPACPVGATFQNGISATDDGIGGGGGSGVNPSNITLGTTSPTLNVLPVTLISFEAEAIQNGNKIGVALNWKTASEINNDYFTVEHSIDGINFEELFQMKGAGTSNDINNYIGFDENPNNGINYYRLKQTDFNGEFEAFEIKVVDFSNFKEFEIFPNPVNSNLTVKFNSKRANAEYRIKIYDNRGTLVYSNSLATIKGINKPKINTEKLSNGLYILLIENESKVYKKRFVKN